MNLGRKLAGWNITAQIGLIVALLLVPLVLMTGMLVASQNEGISFARKELAGSVRATQVWTAVMALARGEPAAEALARMQKGAEADAAFNATAATQAFAKAAESQGGSAALALGAQAIQAIADGSNLTLDPDLDSYYVMDVVVVRLPELTAASGELKAAFAAFAREPASPAALRALAASQRRFETAMRALDGSVQSALDGNGDKSLAQRFVPAGKALVAEAGQVDAAAVRLLDAAARGEHGAVAAPALDGVLRATAAAADAAHVELPRLLEDRIAKSRERLLLELAASGLAVLLALGLAWVVVRSIRGPIRDLIGTLREFQAGNFHGSVLHTDKPNEIGQIARAILKAQETGEQAALTVAALNQSPAMLMITDPEEKIAFISASLTNLLMELEPAFRAARHDFSVEKMEKQHIDYYRANPALRRELILDDGKTRKVKYEVGGQTILVDMAYIYGIDGEKIGHTLLWSNVTEELMGEAEVAAVVNAAQAGDFSARLSLDRKQGFVREIANGLNNVSSLVERAVGECAGVMEHVAQGDLTSRVATPYGGLLGSLSDSINTTIDRLSETVSTIQTTATDVQAAAHEISSGAANLAQRTEQQASALEQTAATTEELAASVKSSAQSSRKGVEMAEQARGVAEAGGEIVRNAVSAMARIEQASRKISDITGVIDEIAFQTNLLALNAAVEAARAGEAGKGFAVVASEVRTLAQRSSEAAKDITALIASSTGEVESGVKLVRSAGEVLEQMVEASRKVSSTIADISDASGEQANGIDEMSQAVAHMDEMTQQNAALAEESAASANALSSQIVHLTDLVASFRIASREAGMGAGRRASAEPASLPVRRARAS
ncbi:MAG: methyl-accepting chemotaxis protein [Alsobacter sp.]